MKRIRWFLLLVLMFCLTGCASEEVEENSAPELGEGEIYTFFVNADRTDVYGVPFDMGDTEDIPTIISDAIEYMAEEVGTAEYKCPIPSGIAYLECNYDNVQNSVRVSFNVLYDSVNKENLLFFKTCIACTVLQLEGVDTVSIALTDLANNDPETATVVETFDKDSFTMNFGDRNGYKQMDTIVLYFADESGQALRAYEQTVEISNTTSLSRLVIESLANGPERTGYQATISEDVTINNISVNDGICYVDLSEEFYDTANPLRNELIVYSVVNSLVDLPTVTKVQFLKNGEKVPFFRQTMPFDAIFERNLDLIQQEDDE
ncbi:MAG: GerMN domain-containing protein [Lachnospiraceae bacterium]|nr:GerMN domain-containing protein [Lachnospiraceae bacterium]